jgi:hypothetical protein
MRLRERTRPGWGLSNRPPRIDNPRLYVRDARLLQRFHFCRFVALSPLLRRIYIEGFWIRGRGTVVRLEGGMNTNPGAGGAWVFEYRQLLLGSLQIHRHNAISANCQGD